METTEKLFREFAPTTREQWKAKAIDDLKGADFDKKLVWKTDDGFAVQPFYTAEDMTGLQDQYKAFAASSRKWKNYVEIEVTDEEQANKTALLLKQSGAEGFLFKVNAYVDYNFHILLHDLDPSADEISFSLTQPSIAFCDDYHAYVIRCAIHPRKLKGFIQCDILEQWSLTGIEPAFHDLAEVLKLFKNYPHFKCLVIGSHEFANAGATTVQELAFTFNKLTAYVDALIKSGVDLQTIISNIMFHFAIGGDYFFEIAKLRASKLILKSLLNIYGVDGVSIPVINSNACWSKSVLDVHVNLLRNTSEAMSAIIGGCDALLVQPHNMVCESPTELTRRIALNIGNILREEAYFDKVADPAAGSYYIENMVRSIAENALNYFKEIESLGGYISAFAKGIIQDWIRQVRNKKEQEIGTRKRVYVGANKYPVHADSLNNVDEQVSGDHKSKLELLVPQSAVKAFEILRRRTIQHYHKTGFIPQVYLACFGEVAMCTARAAFAREFFATGGFSVHEDNVNEDMQVAAQQAAHSKADVIVLCSSDEDYARNAVAFAKHFKSLSKEKILVLAGYPETLIDDLKGAGINEFIHIKTNAVEVITQLQNTLLVD